MRVGRQAMTGMNAQATSVSFQSVMAISTRMAASSSRM